MYGKYLMKKNMAILCLPETMREWTVIEYLKKNVNIYSTAKLNKYLGSV